VHQRELEEVVRIILVTRDYFKDFKSVSRSRLECVRKLELSYFNYACNDSMEYLYSVLQSPENDRSGFECV